MSLFNRRPAPVAVTEKHEKMFQAWDEGKTPAEQSDLQKIFIKAGDQMKTRLYEQCGVKVGIGSGLFRYEPTESDFMPDLGDK